MARTTTVASPLTTMTALMRTLSPVSTKPRVEMLASLDCSGLIQPDRVALRPPVHFVEKRGPALSIRISHFGEIDPRLAASEGAEKFESKCGGERIPFTR